MTLSSGCSQAPSVIFICYSETNMESRSPFLSSSGLAPWSFLTSVRPSDQEHTVPLPLSAVIVLRADVLLCVFRLPGFSD